ncbi:MAG: hypothetical protein ACLUE1_01925 [Adlercreutzia equolifaciens]
MLAGIICARTALIVACYGSYASTDDGIFTDGSMFVTCALFIVALLIFSRSRRELGATVVQWIMVGSITVAAGASMALSLLDSADQTLVATAFALSIASTLALSLCMFYWLRCLCGTDEVTAALFVFSAFFISVGIVYLLRFCPPERRTSVWRSSWPSSPSSARPACAPSIRRAAAPSGAPLHLRPQQHPDSRFLAACAVGMALLGFVDGPRLPTACPSLHLSSRLAYACAPCRYAPCSCFRRVLPRARHDRGRVYHHGAGLPQPRPVRASLPLGDRRGQHAEHRHLRLLLVRHHRFTSFEPATLYLRHGRLGNGFGSRSLARMLLYFTYPLAATICSSTRFWGSCPHFHPSALVQPCTPSAENRLGKPIA